MRTIKRISIFCTVLLILGVVGMFFLAASAGRPSNLGVSAGRLAPCPNSPNCVSTQATDSRHGMQPIPFSGDVEEALRTIEAIVRARPRTIIVTMGNAYLHAEFTSRLFRFVDDVEFFVDENAHQIHFRSASRVGHSDLGANWRRMESIRSDLVERLR